MTDRRFQNGRRGLEINVPILGPANNFYSRKKKREENGENSCPLTLLRVDHLNVNGQQRRRLGQIGTKFYFLEG